MKSAEGRPGGVTLRQGAAVAGGRRGLVQEVIVSFIQLLVLYAILFVAGQRIGRGLHHRPAGWKIPGRKKRRVSTYWVESDGAEGKNSEAEVMSHANTEGVK